MELFTKLFSTWLLFVYHCFDRIVLSGYLMGLQRIHWGQPDLSPWPIWPRWQSGLLP
jgi:hypothetical protein